MDISDRTNNPYYLNGEELVRRINVLKQDADGGLYEQYKPLLDEAVEKGVSIQAIDALLQGLGFDHTKKLFHDDLIAKKQAEDSYSPSTPRM